MPRLPLLALALLAACSQFSVPGQPEPLTPEPWQPGTLYPTARAANARGFVERKGLIHAHSVYSHDACDGKPRDAQGRIDRGCLDDFRRGLCEAHHDYVMLTDHPDSFTRVEFPDTLLFQPDKGDRLLERDGRPVANRLACPDGAKVLVLAGTESNDAMPVGLERHVSDVEAERGAVYGGKTAETIARMKAAGAVSLIAHTEGWTADALVATPLDGFEMFNLHANLFLNGAAALDLIARLDAGATDLPHPALVLVPIYSEDPAYLGAWGSVLARGVHRVTTMGTDCHQNTFAQLLADGDRIDSYRRMMGFFSNHLLAVPTATYEDGREPAFDDRALKDALRAARLFGVFEMLGTPEGFDFFATGGGTTFDMGADAPVGSELVVKTPALRSPNPADDAPVITSRLLRAKEGGFDVVAEGAGELRYAAAAPGAFRAEVRMQPKHLKRFLGRDAAELSKRDLVWVYSNAIYVK